MKKLIKPFLGLSLVAAMVACGGGEKKMEEKKEEKMEEKTEAVEKTVDVNLAESKIMWEGSMLGVKSHSGNIKLTEGKLMMKGSEVTGGKFKVDMKTINPTDSSYSEDKTPEMLVGHLSTADFFHVDSFPTASFVIKSSNMQENTITGDLTVRGLTKEEKIEDVKIDSENGEATGKLTFDRQDYNVSYSTGAKDFVISDDIELDIKLKM